MWNEPTKEQLDNIPRFNETNNIPLLGKLIYLHFFIHDNDWYIAEYDGGDLFWGFVILKHDYRNAEWDYISFQELQEMNINGIEVDCEINWQPWPAGEIYKIKECRKLKIIKDKRNDLTEKIIL